MEKSEQIGQIAKALSQAQAKFPKIIKDKTVKTNKYEFSYAELDQIIEKVTPVLAEHGIAVSQPVGDGVLTTILMHESGEWISDVAEIQKGAYDQQVGASITYRRRYCLASILNIAAEDDVDGEDEDGSKETGKVEGPELINQEELEELQKEIPNQDYLKKLLAAYGIKTLRDLPYSKFEEVREILAKRRK